MIKNDVDTRYDQIRKMMEDLSGISNDFDSIILSEGHTPAINTEPLVLSPDDFPADLPPKWGFIPEKDISVQRQKLLK